MRAVLVFAALLAVGDATTLTRLYAGGVYAGGDFAPRVPAGPTPDLGVELMLTAADLTPVADAQACYYGDPACTSKGMCATLATHAASGLT